MPRNLDHRIEILVPIEEPQACRHLSRVFDVLLADNVQSWELRADGSWTRLRPEPGRRPRPAQAVLMRSTKLRSRTAPVRRLAR
jgi:polyphosphate kinase